MRKFTCAALSGALVAGTLAISAVPASADMSEFCNRQPGNSRCLDGGSAYRDRDSDRGGRVYFGEDRSVYYEGNRRVTVDGNRRTYLDRDRNRRYRDRDYYRRRGNDNAAATIFGLAAGAILGAALGDDHVSWCHDRYRSYRRHDNSWKPYRGSRRVCHSPYS